MEWLGKNNTKYHSEDSNNQLIDFFIRRNYLVYQASTNKFLDKLDWKNWPSDVLFLKNGYFKISA